MTSVTTEQKESIGAELPEANQIENTHLRDKVLEVWALAIDESSFDSISQIKASGNPDTPPLTTGTQADHLRGGTTLSSAIA